MYKRKNQKILIKILIMVVFFSLLEIFITIGMFHDQSQKALYGITNATSERDAEMYANMVGNWFDERMSEVAIYANNPLIKTMDWNRIEPYLKEEIQGKTKIYDHFLIADTTGAYNTTLKRNPSNIKDREYFKQAMLGHAVVSDPLISRTTGHSVAIVAIPIKNEQNQVVGLMGAAVNLSKLSLMIEKFAVDHPDSYSYIVDSSGTVLAHPDTQLIMSHNITREDPEIPAGLAQKSNQILNKEYGQISYIFRGIHSTSYFHEIPKTNGWKVVTKVPDDYVERPIDQITAQLVYIGLIVTMISVFFGILISNSISRPIIQLSEVFKRAASGDLTVRASLHSNDEVEEAAQSFNTMMEKISKLTFNDPLTELPNKISFTDRLSAEISRAAREKEKLAVMILDIDKFQHVNNTFGSAASDKLLRYMAEGFRSLYDNDVMVSRLSDDRFIFLFTLVTLDMNLVKTAEQLLEYVKRPWQVDQYKIFITASIGIAIFPNDGDTAQSLIKSASGAMHMAKEHHRDSYHLFDESISKKLEDQLLLDNSLHTALENKEFVLYYQPQVDPSSGKIIGAEALIRWLHPELGLILPGRFIPYAEQNGMITQLGDWVLQTACRQNAAWQQSGCKPIYISVNISSLQVKQPDFIDKLTRALAESGLAPQHLELEITESIAMEDITSVKQIISRLRELGVRIAIDDFGTGYSSLKYLKELSLTTLKIDRSFVSDISTDDKGKAIVSTILNIGHNLGLLVTAEGVETTEQLDYLKSKGCNVIQGYYFYKPMPGEDLEKLF